MKEKTKYIITIIFSFFIGVIGTLITIKYIPELNKQKSETIKTVSITETDTIKKKITKKL